MKPELVNFQKSEPVSVVKVEKRLGELGDVRYFVHFIEDESSLSVCFSSLSSVLDFIAINF